jgi:hypothetical protein
LGVQVPSLTLYVTIYYCNANSKSEFLNSKEI